MRVRFINPSNKKFGTVEHIENTAGRTLIALGECEAVPYRDFRERLAAEASPAAAPVQISWGVKEADGSVFSTPTIVKKVGSETFYFDGPPADCPPSIVAQYNELKNVDPGAARAAIEKAKREQEEQERAERTRTRSLVVAGK